MKLQDFVSETLTQIVAGVEDAQNKIEDVHANGTQRGKINPPVSTSAETLEKKGYRVDTYGRTVQNVEFDVAVMVDETTEVKGKAGLFVAAIGFGVKAGMETKDATVHRIKFAVPVVLPRGQE